MNTATNKTASKRMYGDGDVRYHKKRKLWEARLSFGTRGNGTRDRRSRYAHTETEAWKLVKKMQKERDASINKSAQNTTLNVYADCFLENKRSTIEENSLIRVRQTFEHNILPEIGFMRLGALSYADCEYVINKTIREGYSYSTIKKVYEALDSCLRWAVKKRDIQYNPMAALAKPTKKDKRIKAPKQMKPFNKDECELLVKESKRKYKTGNTVYRLGWLFILLLETGLRIGEALALLWEDVDFKTKTLLVKQTTVIAEEETSKKGIRKFTTEIADRTKTHAGYREIKLTDAAIEALIELRKVTGEFMHVSATKTGTLVTHRNILKTFHGLLRRIGLPQRGLHQLRHTYATNRFIDGVNVVIISKMLGHRSVEFTIDTYIHIIEELKRKGVNIFDFRKDGSPV